MHKYIIKSRVTAKTTTTTLKATMAFYEVKIAKNRVFF